MNSSTAQNNSSTDHLICALCGLPAKTVIPESSMPCCATRATRCKTPNLSQVSCYGCGSPATKVNRWGAVCGSKCPVLKKRQRQRFEDTMQEKYGVKNAINSEEIRKRIKTTTRDRYGVEHASKAPGIFDKARLRYKEQFGVEHWTQLEETKQAKKDTILKKFGVSQVFKSADFVRRRRDSNPQRYGEVRSKEEWLQKEWGYLRLVDSPSLPHEWNENSHSKFPFLCDCGHVKAIKFKSVSSLKVKSCKMCNKKSTSFWKTQTFGSLRLQEDQPLPDEIGKNSHDKFLFDCTCGRSAHLSFKEVTGGNTQSCGRCTCLSKEHWLQQVWGHLILDPDQSLPEEWAPCSGNIFVFRCQNCSQLTSKPFVNVNVSGVSSCGCIAPGKSLDSPAGIIFQYVKELAPDAEFSYWFPSGKSRREYDIYVPSKQVAIEYHGLYWHTEGGVGKNDYQKFLASVERGDRLVQIYQDEWEDNPSRVKDMLKSILQPSLGKRIRPTFEVHWGTPTEARAFLDRHHYLGAASGCLTILARYREEVVGVWVFMKREQGTVLWHRACWHPEYRAWNPHEKALRLAKAELVAMGFTRIVTFSDNRWHTGNLYEKLGFTFDKELAPDYSYTNGVIRKSKYALRVPAGVNEVRAANEKGWYRIWDSGKKRFLMSLV